MPTVQPSKVSNTDQTWVEHRLNIPLSPLHRRDISIMPHCMTERPIVFHSLEKYKSLLHYIVKHLGLCKGCSVVANATGQLDVV